ncbi:hypothetical protein SAMN04488490_1189 [Marinobacter sp. LV10R510-11A]|uniref:hypothetical protein n=1 Tax=Marinobacter sp. LV10R510-11A TaxID=1415568 RepID=UPI000BB8B5F8|nr:hypothetical protein [Marinobacter sp. LV10R510-11A]SOB75578.1 hypothetical protein SAMN04488490_1189 [Marinobacter sp. LV10R510-11A]
MKRIPVNQKVTQINILILASLFASPYAQAAFSEKWGYISVSATLLFLFAIFGLGGLQILREHFKPKKLSDFGGKLYALAIEAELHHKKVATQDENLDKWADDHICRRVAFLSRYIEPLVDQGFVRFEQAVKKEDFVLITRYYDLVHFSRLDSYSRQRGDEVEIKRYLKNQSDNELRTFTLEKLIRSCFLNQKIGAPKADQLWAEICDQYDKNAAG